MENIPQIKGIVEKLSNEIDGLEENIEPFLDERTMAQEFDDPADRAKYYNCMAYSLTSLLFAYLKSTGKDTTQHDVMKELDRVKSYMAKVKEAVDGRQKPRNPIDKEAANRFIKSALAGNKDGNYLTKMAENNGDTATHKRFDDSDDDKEDKSNTKKRSNEDSDIEEVSPPKEQKKDQQKPKKKKKPKSKK